MKKLTIIFLIIVKLLFSQEAKADFKIKSTDPVCGIAQAFLFEATSTESQCKYKNGWYHVRTLDTNMENYETQMVNSFIAIDYALSRMPHSNKVNGVILLNSYSIKKVSYEQWNLCVQKTRIDPECILYSK